MADAPRNQEYELTDGDYMTTVTLDQLVADNTGLRTEVNKSKSEWPGFVQNIKSAGVLSSILIRPHPKEANKFIIINGYHRFEAAKEALLITNTERQEQSLPPIQPTDYRIPAVVTSNLDRMGVLKLQLTLNSQTIPTRPIQYSEQIQRILQESNFTMTLSDVAELLDTSPTWVSNMLKLRTLRPEAKKALEDGTMVAANAFHLARLPDDEQEHFLDRAIGMTSPEFAQAVGDRIAVIRKNTRATRPDASTFIPTAKLRSKSALIRDMEIFFDANLSSVSEDEINLIDRTSTPYYVGYYEGLQYVLSLDQASVDSQEEEFKANLAARLRKLEEKSLKKQIGTATGDGVSVFGKKGPSLIGL